MTTTAPTHPGPAGTRVPPYRLVRTPPAAPSAPVLDPHQEAVAAHPGGPLLVLAGPGTGKTTTLVETVARRVERGTDPERILVLTFSRKAAAELRDRLALRVGGAAAAPRATTFHSFCYALVRAHQDPELFSHPVRLLSGPEQDLMVREMLAGEAEAATARAGDGAPRWPHELRACLTTRGFADEVRAVLARSRELGLGPGALERFAHRAERPDWQAAAHFLADYLDVLDQRGVLDYAELVHRAVLLAEEPEVLAELRKSYELVVVDEYQDTDPAQVRLLDALAGDGRDLVAVGDPDQSIYAFRGADVGGILEFRDRFRRGDGSPADVRVLRVNRRSGSALLAATRETARRMPLRRLPAEQAREHRAQAAARPGGRVQVFTYPTAGAELDNIADILRRAHLEDGVPWSSMAVLVRAGARSLPAMRRTLTAAGVPLDVDGDDLPLRAEPAVAPLLTALRVAAEAALAREAGDAALTAETARMLLTSPLGGLDSADLRRLGRELRDVERTARALPGGGGPDAVPEPGAAPEPGSAREPDQPEPGGAQQPDGPDAGGEPDTAPAAGPSPGAAAGAPAVARDAPPAPGPPPAAEDAAADADAGGDADTADAPARTVPASDELVRRALLEPERLTTLEHGRGARRLALLLRGARDLLARGGTPEEALWLLWDGTGWPDRLERAARRGGPAGRNADRDLDAVCALFETAARAEDRVGRRGALNFLAEVEAQDIAADTLAARAVRPDAVRLLTAHRAKGLEWRLVVVAGLQEGLWPDLRRRGSLLEADRIGADGLAEPMPPGALLAEERRLFYTAATRARERLVVTAVKAPAEDGDQPSRFLTELGVDPVDVSSRPRRALSVPALVAELRAATVDPEASEAVRAAAARRLARLAALTDDDGTPLVPAAHPDRWWGLAEPTRNEVPVRDPARPVQLTASGLEQLGACPLQWFLQKEARADRPTGAAQGFGSVVHALADEVGSGSSPADLGVLLERLDTVWDALAFDAPWKSEQEKAAARSALERFVHWHAAERGRTAAASEHPFDVVLRAGGTSIRVRGSMDRVERGDDGLAYVVDFKTGKHPPTDVSVRTDPQLAVYQLAVRAGALDGVPAFARPEGEDADAEESGDGPPRVQPGGAELVHLREPAKGDPGLPRVQPQDALDHPQDGPEPPAEGDGAPPGEEPWIDRLLTEAAGRVLSERFAPRLGDRCRSCTLKRACSAHPEGRQVVE